MFQDVEGRDEVEAAGIEREVQDIGITDLVESTHAAELQRLIGDVDAFRGAERAQLLEHQACAAARVEHVQVMSVGVVLTNRVQHDVASRGKPPVSRFGPIEDLVCV